MKYAGIEEITQGDIKLFLDTCSMLHSKYVDMIQVLLPHLAKGNNKIYIPYSCYKELLDKANQKTDLELRGKAKLALAEISKGVKLMYFELIGSVDDQKFADHVFLSSFTKYRTKHSLALITEDGGLRKDIQSLNASASVKGKEILITNVDSVIKSAYTKKKAFEIKTEITRISPKELLPVSIVPSTYSIVYTKEGAEVLLGESLGCGKEGVLYRTNACRSEKDLVAKIYKKEELTRQKKEKILTILSSGVEIEGVCFPTDALYDSEKNFVGFLMPIAQGVKLELSIFRGERGFMRHFPNWGRLDLVNLGITILTTIKEIQKQGALLGDINGSNIMVKSPTEVFFVDTDSYQINEFPCPVCTPAFTAPEILGKEFRSFLRTMGNEQFAVATLIFKILFLGLDPYAHKDGGSPAANIESGNFSFPFGGKSNKKIPSGDWKYYWSHLPKELKRLFYTTFKKGECHYQEDQRPKTNSWIRLMTQYRKDLESGKIEAFDAESIKLFPKRYKRDANSTYVTCKLCKKDTPEQFTRNGYCHECLSVNIGGTCTKCGSAIEYTNHHKYLMRKPEPKFCNKCGNEIVEIRECKDCHQLFEINQYEYDFYQQKRLEVPCRCKSCRKSKTSTSSD